MGDVIILKLFKRMINFCENIKIVNNINYFICFILLFMLISFYVYVKINNIELKTYEKSLLFCSPISTIQNIAVKKNKIKILYNNLENQIKIPKPEGIDIDISKIKFKDEYYNKRYILEFPVNYIDFFDSNEYKFNDNYIESINISNKNGKTNIIINEKAILTYTIKQDDDYIYINAHKPKEIFDKIVIIDAGHGGVDPGADAFGIFEKDICFNIANKVVEYIEKNTDIKVYLTRIDDTKIDNEKRINSANYLGDLFVSIHINSNDYSPNITGTEVYYYEHNDKNVDEISKKSAEIICDYLSESLKSRNRGIKTENYLVLKKAEIPSVLCEVGFLTNKEEAFKLNDKNYQDRAAKAIYEGITKIFEFYKPER